VVKESILNGKRILAVDDEPDVLSVLKEEIAASCEDYTFDAATTYQEAVERMVSWSYDVVILDIMGVRGFDLLKLAVDRGFSVAMLTAHSLTPESLRRSIEMGARAYLPKEKLGEIVPFLEDILTYESLPGWKRLLKKLGGFFNARWGEAWKKSEEWFWKEFDREMESIKEDDRTGPRPSY
jgi:CheY-like chemotaxis protein